MKNDIQFNGYKFFFNKELWNEFHRDYTNDEQVQVNYSELKLNTIKQYDDILHVFYSRFFILQRVSILMLIPCFFLYTNIFVLIPIIFGSLSLMIYSIHCKNEMNGYYRSYGMSLSLIEGKITQYFR